jgi:hypothetical protein
MFRISKEKAVGKLGRRFGEITHESFRQKGVEVIEKIC